MSDTPRTDVLQDALEEGPSTATHFDGCEKYHHACALAQLTALRARLDAANMEIAAKTDLWRRETARAQASERGAARCREWADAIHRYGKEGKDSAMVAVITEMSLWAQANAAKKGGRDAA